MSQAPAMPVWTDALIGDTTHLSAEEFGAYCLILFATWRNNGKALKDDDVSLARVARVGSNRWATKIRPRLIEFFDTSDGCWHQKRLESEWENVAKKRKRQSVKGKRSAELRALKKQETSTTVVPLRLQPNGNHPYPIDSSVSSLRSETEATPPYDPVKELFDAGIRVITNRGIPERQARSLLGRWRKDLKDDGKLLSLLLAVEREMPVDVIGYMAKAVQRASTTIQPFSSPGFA